MRCPAYSGSHVFIYGLCDPRTGAVRYIGSTTDPQKRLHQHRRHPSSFPVSDWLHELRRADLAPDMCLIDWCSIHQRLVIEQRWIGQFLSTGQELLNVKRSLGSHGCLKPPK